MGSLFLNYDNGVIPACQIQMMDDLNLDSRQIAFVASAVYVGLAVSSIFVAQFFARYPARGVLLVAFIENALACFLFTFSSNFWLLALARFILGWTQAYCVIYAPVWINTFAPRESSTRWLSY